MKSNPPAAGKGPHRDPARERSWRKILRQFAASGQSIRGFCAARQLKETAFYFWRAEIQRRDSRTLARRPCKAAAQPAFAEVVVQPPIVPPAQQSLRLRLGGGRELLLPASWPIDQVAALLRAIEGAP